MPSDSTSAQLRSLSADEWERGLRHPLVVSTADDSISAEVFDRWVVTNTYFVRTYRRFMMVMSTLAPDTRASRLLFSAVQDLDEELRRSAEFLDGRQVDESGVPSARAMDYSSYCMASVGQGWTRGIVVAYGVERLFTDAWTGARSQSSPRARFWDFVDLWSNRAQGEFVAGLAVLVDELALTPELERIFRTTVRLELASWDEAYGLDPGVGSFPTSAV